MTTLAREIISCIESVVPKEDKPIGHHEPEFQPDDYSYLKECLDSGWVSTVGPFVNKFEELLKSVTGAKYVVAASNGTVALQIALQVAGVKRDDEVLIPSLSFVATANAVHYNGAIPHFVDVNLETFGIDPVKLNSYLSEITEVHEATCFNKKTKRPLRALVLMHTFGHAGSIDEIKTICDQYHIEFIEDAAESMGSLYKKKHTGTFGKVSALSFNGNKIITCGGGGAILTDDETIAKHAKHLTTTAKVPHPWEFQHDEIGYNFRLPNLNAALGCAQMKQLNRYVTEKRSLAKAYAKSFRNHKAVLFFEAPENCESNYWLNSVRLIGSDFETRTEVIAACHEAGYFVRPTWAPLHTLPMFQECPRDDLAITNQLYNEVICLPSSARLGRRYV